MAAGRNQVDYTDIGIEVITLWADGVTITYDRTKANGIGIAAGAGLSVMFAGDDTIALTNDGAAVTGKLLRVEQDLACSVQVGGYANLPKGDSAPGTATRGRKVVGATRGGVRGYVRDLNTATAAELGVARGQIQNVADADNIVVKL